MAAIVGLLRKVGLHSNRLLSCSLLLSVCLLARAEGDASPLITSSLPASASTQAVANHLVGLMDTSAQAARDEKFPNVRMTTCEVKMSGGGFDPNQRSSIFLYQEQALTQRLSKPYRQRFLRLSLVFNGQVVQSLSFRPENPEAWVGLCDRAPDDRLISPIELGKPVCSVILKPVGNEYIGLTPVDGCPANYRGATRITNRVRLHVDGMDTWDRGFDQTGTQIWGADEEAYQFRWIRP